MTLIFSTSKAPKVLGPYSKSFQAGNLVFCSGQIGVIPETMELIHGGVEEETRQACRNIREILSEHKLGLKDVVKVTIFVKNINDFEKVNEIYKDYFIMKPARSFVEVSGLPKKANIEIEVIAKI